MAWLILPKLKRLCLLCQTSYNEGMEIFLGICFPLFITLAVETPLVLWIMNRYDPSFALFVVAVNVATNLALTTLTYYVMKPYGAYNPPLLFLAELVIALIEAASYAIYTRKVGYAFLASFAANLSSFIVGGSLEIIAGYDSYLITPLLILWIIAMVLFALEVILYCVFHAKHAGKPSPSQPQPRR
jgi:hypothetical protein